MLKGKVNPARAHFGPQPMFSKEEEAHLVEHINTMAECGYGYGRAEGVTMASEYAVYLEKRTHPLLLKWFRGFMLRWTKLKVFKPRGLELQRTKAINMESVTRYYTELGSILDKYCLKNKPERVYNIDEKGLSTSHTPY
ncbi:hypothetical protein DPMN_133172 [Dreissena polymorpha]|uniref:HTH CENPB-type domain-containing protein n=1 Tax=Dreissena polymorpha TaxID=45954 RepID=A0A9D4FTR9_DREPO|nr:hypothetical protein DPMN_133172 [Dreissena polymorpha]